MERKQFSVLIPYYYFVLVLLYLPILVLFLFSINDGIAFTFPLQGVTNHWYTDMLQNAELLRAVRNSVIVAIACSTLTSILATAAALALTRFNFKGKQIFLVIALMPLLVPFLILGVALLILFAALDIDRSLLTVILAHVIITFPYALLILMARLVSFDPRLEEAAQDLGATYPYTLRRVILPLIAPTLLAAWLVAFTISFDEYVLASFLNGGQVTLPVFIFGQLRFANRFPQVIALAIVVMVVSLSLFIIAQWLQQSGSESGFRSRTQGQAEHE